MLLSPEALLATWITDRAGLERYSGSAAPVTDDRPLIEHGASSSDLPVENAPSS